MTTASNRRLGSGSTAQGSPGFRQRIEPEVGLAHLHLHHARHGAQRASDLGRSLVAAREPDFDLAVAAVKEENQRDFTLSSAFPTLPQALGDAVDRALVAQENPQTLLAAHHGLVQRFGGLDARAHL